MDGPFLYCQNEECREYTGGGNCLCGWKQPEPEPDQGVSQEDYAVLLADRDALAAQVEAMRVDAELLDFLIQESARVVEGISGFWIVDSEGTDLHRGMFNTAREAIDAARKEQS